jgi:hypothetical protein
MTFETREKPVFAGSPADGTLMENRHGDWQNAAAGGFFWSKYHFEVETLRSLGFWQTDSREVPDIPFEQLVERRSDALGTVEE